MYLEQEYAAGLFQFRIMSLIEEEIVAAKIWFTLLIFYLSK
jgi:hypothetical protein